MPRKQLTLFIRDNSVIEQLRKRFNPVQFSLIAAHVTLCREDEIADLEKVKRNLEKVRLNYPVKMFFDKPLRFEAGKGVLLPVKGDHLQFDALRGMALQGLVATPRIYQPHITLMHPRNSTCTDEIFEEIARHTLPLEFSFDRVSLIEEMADGKWITLDSYCLVKGA
ncbi:2'-5' RNA ligase family protein [Mucilaginibacter paludis]|uniref:Phosphoesterase HXTX n=1 Tax=Mucilaginibacter paludis DSM 18603 TaxID=714943 RepID=H1YC62_9SPHI|nr:2'-5' RNA ligase family protein [Mucilaginibacter paludis]EHQ29625.1 hypothetical protein Mucpa_5554 [Mucilaginibacter paludis DSM 18603]